MKEYYLVFLALIVISCSSTDEARTKEKLSQIESSITLIEEELGYRNNKNKVEFDSIKGLLEVNSKKIDSLSILIQRIKIPLNVDSVITSVVNELQKSEEYTQDCEANPNSLRLPKLDDTNTSLGDLNNDGITDLMVLYMPQSCGMGNYLMGLQVAKIFLSEGDKYIKIEYTPSNSSGFGRGSHFRIIEAIDGGIKAEYLEYAETDGRCCPSIKKLVILPVTKNGVEAN